MRYITVEDEFGLLRPQACLWPTGEKQKYYQSYIDKFMKLGVKEGLKLVEVEIIKIKDL